MAAIHGAETGWLPWAPDHHRAYRKLFCHPTGMVAICGDLPEQHNTVTLDPVLKDPSGVPAPKISYSLAEMMIPASPEYDVPSAGDETIFADILNSIGHDAGHVAAVLQTLDRLAGGVFADLDPQRRDTIAARLRDPGSPALTCLTRIVMKCYYRDDRVMRSLGMEVRPPFPKGFEVEQGDWSLLDPVRARPKLYREVP
jgi:hypothetical protein